MILLDTNLLGRMTDSSDAQCATARRAVQTVFSRGEQPAIVPQNLYEFWAVATRSQAANGSGLTPDQASQWLGFFQRRFTLLPDRAELPARWHELVRTRRITGFRAHDARLVAAMQTYRISRIVTFNGNDFTDLPVTVVDPATV